MKLTSEYTMKIKEYAYETQEECGEHTEKMLRDGYEVKSVGHDVYMYYREYIKYC